MESADFIVLKCILASTDSTVPLGMRILLDDKTIYENFHIKDQENVEYKLSDVDAEHTLVFELFGKLPSHTKINESGEILKDALIFIKDLTIDDIDISQVMQDLAVYRHNFNGTSDTIEDVFRNAVGCNGTVSLKFTTPVYLWLLENM